MAFLLLCWVIQAYKEENPFFFFFFSRSIYPLIVKWIDLGENKEMKLNILSLCKADVKQTSRDPLDQQLLILDAATTVQMDAQVWQVYKGNVRSKYLKEN